jgi:RHS repeat-associated protein
VASWAGNVSSTTTHLPFGAIEVETGSVDEPYKFTGKELEREFGLYYFGARYYNPHLGRWMSVDPLAIGGEIEQSLGPYVYCDNDPFNMVDPDGLYSGGVESRGMAKAQRIEKDAASDRKTSVRGAVMAVEAAATMLNPGGLLGSLAIEALQHKDAIVEFGKKVYSRLKNNPKKAVKEGIQGGTRKAKETLKNAKKKIEKKCEEIAKDVRPDATDTRSTWDRAKDLIKKVGPLAVALAAAMRGGRKGRPERLKPDDKAEGPHTVFNRDRGTGRVKRYETYRPQTNPRDPKKWERVKALDAEGPRHWNKATQRDVPTPHVHDPNTPGGVRPATPEETPK